MSERSEQIERLEAFFRERGEMPSIALPWQEYKALVRECDRIQAQLARERQGALAREEALEEARGIAIDFAGALAAMLGPDDPIYPQLREKIRRHLWLALHVLTRAIAEVLEEGSP